MTIPTQQELLRMPQEQARAYNIERVAGDFLGVLLRLPRSTGSGS